MAELKRVLKPTGTCWINLGDTYSAKPSGLDPKYGERGPSSRNSIRKDKTKTGILEKSRIAVPERFYIDCIDDGWRARNHIPWIKSNPMPQSVRDRFSNHWESVFFLAKEREYYFNLSAVCIRAETEKPKRLRMKAKNATLFDSIPAPEEQQQKYFEVPGQRPHGIERNRKQDSTLGSDGRPKATYAGFNDRWKGKASKEWLLDWQKNEDSIHGNNSYHPLGKNPGDVLYADYTDEELLEWIKICRSEHAKTAWRIAPPDLFFINPEGFSEAHFAVFPVRLPLTILKAACPEQVCTECGLPRQPIVKATDEYRKFLDDTRKDRKPKGGTVEGYSSYTPHRANSEYVLSGFTKCGCGAPFRPGIVLDPFFGSGTTGVAAEMLGMDWVGIEIKEEYTKIARRRLEPYMNLRLDQQAQS